MGITISPVNIEKRKELGIRPGDTVRVWQKIEEKGKTRLQAFEGLVLSRKHGSEPGATFTVRRVASGVGIEKIFPLYSPMIDKIEIVRRSRVRRAKLYYIREKVAREIRRQMRHMKQVDLSTGSDIEERAKTEDESEEKGETVKEEVVEKEAGSKNVAEGKKGAKTNEVGSPSGDGMPGKPDQTAEQSDLGKKEEDDKKDDTPQSDTEKEKA